MYVSVGVAGSKSLAVIIILCVVLDVILFFVLFFWMVLNE